MKRLAPIWEVVKVVLAVFIVAIAIRYFIFQPFVVDGSSMETNFHNGEYLFVEKVSYHFYTPERGQVIVFQAPPNPNVNYIKRIIGLPGETVTIADNKVYVNGKVLAENYLASGVQTIVSNDPSVPYQVTVGPNQYFVMGDNREHSSDSREGWLVPRSAIIGRAAVVLYPQKDFHFIGAPKYSS